MSDRFIQKHLDAGLNGAVPDAGIIVNADDQTSGQTALKCCVLTASVDMSRKTGEGECGQNLGITGLNPAHNFCRQQPSASNGTFGCAVPVGELF